MDLGIAGKVALVTASSKGLGRASAMALATEGARVVISARGEDALERTANEIADAGGQVHAVVADVTELDAPAHLVQEAVETFGGLDILVANAGGPPPKRALDLTDEDIKSGVDANLITTVRLIRESVPQMKQSNWGRIVAITSSSIKEPISTLALSNTARTGLWAWSKTAAQDLFTDGITLNHACPGMHATDRMKEIGASGRMGSPEDFGKIVAFMCSQPAAFMSGAAVVIDGSDMKGLL